MDRACVQRARHLRERVGFVDRGTTYKEFADYVEGHAAAAAFETFKARWERARTGIVLTAHPTFGLSDALSRRMIEIAVADEVDPNTRIGVPHRPDDGITLDYEHERAQKPSSNLRDAYVDLLNGFFSVAAQLRRQGLQAAPQADDVRLLGRLRPRRAHRHRLGQLVPPAPQGEARRAHRHPRALPRLKNELPADGEAQRLARQVTGKLDLAIAAVDEQIEALDKVMRPTRRSPRRPTSSRGSDGYNITTVEPIVSAAAAS